MIPKSIFISYSRQDMDFVDLLATKLSAAGFAFWRDTDNLQPGTVDWERAIREAISKSNSRYAAKFIGCNS